MTQAATKLLRKDDPNRERRAAARARWSHAKPKSSPPDEKTAKVQQRFLAAAAQGKDRFHEQWKKEFPNPPKPNCDALAKGK